MMKYTKRLSALFCAVMLVLCASVTAFADTHRMIDEADLYTSSEETELVQKLNDASDSTGWDVIIYTNENGVDSYDMEYFCNDYYDDNGFGLGDEYSGIMLTVDMDSREMYILTKGDTMYYFSDDRVDAILDNVAGNLSDGDYIAAADAFLSDVEYYYNEGEFDEDDPSSNIYIDEYEDTPLILLVLKKFGIVAGIIAIVAAVLSVVFVSLRYKNHGKEGTYDLQANSSVHLTNKEDVFLYKNVTVTVDSDSNHHRSSGGGGGGRSSSHGGGGRSF